MISNSYGSRSKTVSSRATTLSMAMTQTSVCSYTDKLLHITHNTHNHPSTVILTTDKPIHILYGPKPKIKMYNCYYNMHTHDIRYMVCFRVGVCDVCACVRACVRPVLTVLCAWKVRLPTSKLANCNEVNGQRHHRAQITRASCLKNKRRAKCRLHACAKCVRHSLIAI